MSLGRDVLFNFPQIGWLIALLIPFFLGQFALSYYRKKMESAYTTPALLSRLLIPRSPLLRYTKMMGWGVIWALTCLALMEPFGNIRYSSLSANAPSNIQSTMVSHEILFLVDTSASMRVPDGNNDQSRLETAKNLMTDLLLQFQGQTVSLYAFTSELSQVVPSTLDYIFTRLAINDLHIDQGDVGGTRLAPVLTALKQQVFSEPTSKRYTIILLSDGGDTQLETLTGEAQDKEKEAILNALPNAEQFHFRLYSIGIGSLKPHSIPNVKFNGKPVMSQLDPAILQRLAEHERGKYYMAEKWSSTDLTKELIKQMHDNHSSDSQGKESERKVAAAQKEDIIIDLYYQIPLALVLFFYSLNLLLPDVRRL